MFVGGAERMSRERTNEPSPPSLRVELLLFAAGWGANHFATLLVVYRRELGFSASDLALLFGAYALGLVPGLFLAGRISDARGRRALVLPASLGAIVASAILATGGELGFGALLAGRLLYGLAMGAVMSPGSVWVIELTSPDTGPRRATLALSAGFGLGPFVTAVVAEVLPYPMLLPYVVHGALMACTVVAVRAVPETARVADRSPTRSPPPSFRVLLELVPVAPWAFGLAAVGVAILPGIMRPHVSRPVLYSGVVVVVTLLAGVAAQSLVGRLRGRGDLVGLAIGGVGIGVGTLAIVRASPLLAGAAAALVGAGYGLVMTTGLREVQARVAGPARGTAVGAYYVLTYVGFSFPFVHASLARRLGDPTALALLGAALVGSLAARAGVRAATARTMHTAQNEP